MSSARPDPVDGGPPLNTVLPDTADLDPVLDELPPTVLAEALRRARRERGGPRATGVTYQRAME
jgi:hypothetical protein